MAATTRKAGAQDLSDVVPALTLSDPAVAELYEHARELSDLRALVALADWDQNTVMPEGAGEVRGAQLATLEGLLHERRTQPRVGTLVATLEERVGRASFTDADRALVREVRRGYLRATKLPKALVQRIAEVGAGGFQAWRRARESSDFQIFAPWLTEMVDLQREAADRLSDDLGAGSSRYDALLDEYEPGITEREVKALFTRVRKISTDLLERIRASGHTVDVSCLEGEFAAERQFALCDRLLREIGYDFARGQMARSPHPFTTGLGAPFDVRVTIRTDRRYLPTAIMAAIHEGGHALYEQGSAAHLARTPLAGAPSLGAHESQSRLWENVIGRSEPFWQRHFGTVRQAFRAHFRAVEPVTFARALNRVQPSLIRIEADEVTYNLHIIIRFELEAAIINGEVQVDEVPALWNARYREYLGVAPEREAEGVLQDVHWSQGGFGYFPTYTLGNLYAAQIAAALRRTFPDLDERLARNGTGFILAWLREHMYGVGAIYRSRDLLERVTSETLNLDHFERYLNAKYSWVYGLPARAVR